ncbi:MAG TPA: hypothetical protein VF808_12315 [Ktedonobacterales bacterium]
MRKIAPFVVCVALTLVACAGRGNSPSGASTMPAATLTSTAVPTPATTSTPWPAGPGNWQALTKCASAPPNFRTLYSAGLDTPEQGSATQVTFQRSDTCGASWVKLTPPMISGVVYNTNVQYLAIFPSPINPQVAFLTIQTSLTVGVPACSTPAGATAAHGGVNAAPAASYICQLQYVTKDSGVTWQALSLPVKGGLGGVSPELNVSLDLLGQVRAQGARIYGVVTNAVLGASGIVPPGRLVASDDGGLTWVLADGGLADQGLAIWDFAPTPSGTTVYVTAEPVNDPARVPPGYGATLSIWVSPDGGLTWRHSSSAPGASSGKLVEGMLAGVSPAGKRAVYLLTGDKSERSVLGSIDDGVTWQGDPSFSFPTVSGGMMGFPTFIATLPDTSVIVVNPYGGAPIVAWTPDGGAPHAIAEATALFPYEYPTVQLRSDGVYLWLMGEQGGPGLLMRYTKLRL